MSLDAWAARAVHEITLPSGEVRKVRLPNMEYMIAAGRIPAAVLEKMQKARASAGATEGVFTPEEARDDLQFKALMIAEMLVDEEADADLIAKYVEEDKLPGEDVDQLMRYALRQDPFPGKAQ